MITKYRASSCFPPNGVEKVFFATETSAFLITKDGARVRKYSGYHNYYDSFEEAKQSLITAKNHKIRELSVELESLNNELACVIGIRERCEMSVPAKECGQ